jgi:hypothetical protein
MGVDVADFDNSGQPGVAITNFDNEMIGLYRMSGKVSKTSRRRRAWAWLPETASGFGCVFLDANLDGWLDFAVANGHIDETVRNIRGNVGYAQPPQLFLNSGKGIFATCLPSSAEASSSRKSVAALPMRTSIATAISIFCSPPTTDQRICIATISSGATAASVFVWWERSRTATGSAPFVRVFRRRPQAIANGERRIQLLVAVRIPVTFGLEKRDRIERVVIDWPSGRTKNTRTSRRAAATSAPKEKESPRRTAIEN